MTPHLFLSSLPSTLPSTFMTYGFLYFFFIFCMYVWFMCACVYMCMGTCSHMCVCMGVQKLMVGALLDNTLLYLLRQDLSQVLELSNSNQSNLPACLQEVLSPGCWNDPPLLCLPGFSVVVNSNPRAWWPVLYTLNHLPSHMYNLLKSTLDMWKKVLCSSF